MTPEEFRRLEEETDRLEKEHGELVKRLSEMIPSGELLAQIKAVEEGEDALIKRWSEELSEDELLARMEARANDMRLKAEALEKTIPGLEALARLLKRCQMPISEVITAIRRKTIRTPEETRILDAWNSIQEN